MEAVEGILINALPMKGLTKVADLLEYDGPILSHFKDDHNYNYLYYWIDYDEDYNRWLVWKTSINQIKLYLFKDISLRNLIENSDNDFFFTVDIDENLNSNKVTAYYFDQLPIRYLPSVNSYYLIEPDELYLKALDSEEVKKVSSKEEDYYVESIKERALYFKLEPVNKRFGNTISIKDAGEFFRNVHSSIKEFFKYYFTNDFGYKYADVKQLNDAFNKVLERLIPRLAYSEIGSFEIGLGLDTVHAVKPEFKEWQFNKFDEYRANVIEVDYNQETSLELLESEFPVEVRDKIFKPIIELRNSKTVTIKTSSNPSYYRNKLKSVRDINKSRFLSKPSTDATSKADVEKEFINVILEVDKNKRPQDIGKQDWNKGLLFMQSIETVEVPLKFVENELVRIEFTEPIIAKLSLVEGIYKLELEYHKVQVNAASKEAALVKLMNNLIEKFTINEADFGEEFIIADIQFKK